MKVSFSNKKIQIEDGVFFKLTKLGNVENNDIYKNAIKSGSISIKNLKKISYQLGIPYPFFFANDNVLNFQIFNYNKNLENKIPNKNNFSGLIRGEEINFSKLKPFVVDLGRKQSFLKRVNKTKIKNDFVNLYAANYKENESVSGIASKIRSYFDIQINELRSGSKTKALKYLISKIENKNILVSKSSFGFMPQNFDQDLNVSGFCVKDNQYPYLLLNLRDGDKNPKIQETEGRQLFTLLCLLTAIGVGKFVIFSENNKLSKLNKKIYKIAAEIILPLEELNILSIENFDDIKYYSNFFKVTPSFLLKCLVDSGKLKGVLKDNLYKEIEESRPRIKNIFRRPSDVSGFSKYNGDKFSKLITNKYVNGEITLSEFNNVLFKKTKISEKLTSDYVKKYKI